jgi:8-oxo-dGTP diphosphatase
MGADVKSIRIAAKAIVVQDGRLLTIKCRDRDGTYYLLPGGGQEFGETLHHTLQRECSEEIGCEIRIGELVFVREYRDWLHEFATAAQDEHALEFMFACSVEGNIDQARASQPDKGQIGVEWLALEELAAYRFYPKALSELIASFAKGTTFPVYCGDVN